MRRNTEFRQEFMHMLLAKLSYIANAIKPLTSKNIRSVNITLRLCLYGKRIRMNMYADELLESLLYFNEIIIRVIIVLEQNHDILIKCDNTKVIYTLPLYK